MFVPNLVLLCSIAEVHIARPLVAEYMQDTKVILAQSQDILPLTCVLYAHLAQTELFGATDACPTFMGLI